MLGIGMALIVTRETCRPGEKLPIGRERDNLDITPTHFRQKGCALPKVGQDFASDRAKRVEPIIGHGGSEK
jgi:hypothetical protein